MTSDKLLRITFFISLAAHGVFFLQAPSLTSAKPRLRDQKIEVHYVKENIEIKPLPKPSKPEPLKPNLRDDPFLKLDSNIVAAKRVPPPYFETSKSPKGLTEGLSELPKPNFSSPDIMIIKKKITLPPIEMAKINNPSYISYYQTVREKIRRSAYQNYTQNETGEVYVSFIISNDGYIKAVHLVDERTSANNYLREVALKSVKNASPFPNFPKDLDYPQLSFNIIISFEIE